MDKTVALEGSVIPCLYHAGEVHSYKGPPLPAEDLVALLCRAVARHAQIGVAIDNLRRILIHEQVLMEEPPVLPHTLMEELRHAITLAQSVVPGAHQEVLGQAAHARAGTDRCLPGAPATTRPGLSAALFPTRSASARTGSEISAAALVPSRYSLAQEPRNGRQAHGVLVSRAAVARSSAN